MQRERPATWMCRLMGLVAFVLATGASQAAVLGVNFNKSVVSIDELTGVATLLNANAGLSYSPNAMAKNGAGVVYVSGGGGLAGTARLSTVDPVTGVISAGVVINLGPGVTASIRGLAFSPGGVLYAISNPISTGVSPPFHLYTIDTATGVGTFVASVNGGIQALEFSSSGTLYGWDVTNSPNGLGLVTIDPATGAITDVNPAVGGSAQDVQGMAFSPNGTLHGANSTLYTIDLGSGLLSPIGTTMGAVADEVRGIAFVAALPPAPGVSLSPPSLAFGDQLVGSTGAAQSVTLQNTGGAALSITGIAASGDFAQTNNCGASLAASATCTISVTFTPTASGARNGTLSVSSNAAGSPHTVALGGTGTAVVPPPPSQPAAAIPTLSEWALIMTSLLVGVIAFLRRRAIAPMR